MKVKSPNQRARDQARLERESRERRKRMMMFAAGAALIAVVSLIVVGAIARGGGSSGTPAGVNREGRVLGDATAPVTITAWEDFQCPFCKQANDGALAQAITEYVQAGKARVEYRHLAILGDESILAAEASECAAEQRMFWDYHDLLFAKQAGENRGAFSSVRLKQMAANLGLDRESFDSCLDSGRYTAAVKDERAAGAKLGLSSTPVFFVNGTRIEGLQPYSVFKAAIEKALQSP